jgi:magnesium dechelatase
VAQISGFYTKLLRDEVVAEWRHGHTPSLHIYCHVSGEEKWLAPPQLRNYIFRRELPLVRTSGALCHPGDP